MFSLNNQLELRKITISSLITCIYLPSIVTFISYKGVLYSVGEGSSFYILALIFVAEWFKSFYLSSSNDTQPKKTKASKGKVGDLLKTFAFMLVVLFGYFVGIILFGAPALDNHEQTLMLSALMTLLTVYPLIAHSGVESSMQFLFGIRNYGRNTIVEMLVNNSIMTVCGAWLGAVVIPLDWDTPWQRWPIPCYLGAIGGYVLSNVYTVFKVSMMSAVHRYPVLKSIVDFINEAHKI